MYFLNLNYYLFGKFSAGIVEVLRTDSQVRKRKGERKVGMME
jgi:hypothetical protein